MSIAPHRARYTVRSGEVQSQAVSFGWGIFLALHIPLALVMRASALIATAHALATLGVGLFFSLTAREPRKTAYVAAYITGAEVLWRMTDANVFWEYGKYATIAILVVTLLRMRKWKHAGLPILFFALLVPSISLTLTSLGFTERAREEISFNLSGPLALSICTLFFSQTYLGWEERKSLIWILVAPLMGIAAIALRGIITAQEIIFFNDSNFLTSGGFGPNQVSAVLGLGTMLLFMIAINEQSALMRLMAIGTGILLLMFSVLTFSRGGLYNAVVSLLLASLFFFRNEKARNSFLFISAIVFLVGGYWIYPRLDTFTGGLMRTRFTDMNPTMRLEIAQAELEVWLHNPVLGVGPGMAKYQSLPLLAFSVAAHTEYTRLIAEHGIPGILVILILITMSYRALRRAPSVLAKAWAAALLAWPLVEMTHAAMRIVAIAFIFGLALADWADTPSSAILTGQNMRVGIKYNNGGNSTWH